MAIRNCGFCLGIRISAPFSLRPPDVFLGAELVPSAAWPVFIRVSLVSRQKLTRQGLSPLISRQAHRTPGMPGSYVGVGHARLFCANENKILVATRITETRQGLRP